MFTEYHKRVCLRPIVSPSQAEVRHVRDLLTAGARLSLDIERVARRNLRGNDCNKKYSVAVAGWLEGI